MIVVIRKNTGWIVDEAMAVAPFGGRSLITGNDKKRRIPYILSFSMAALNWPSV